MARCLHLVVSLLLAHYIHLVAFILAVRLNGMVVLDFSARYLKMVVSYQLTRSYLVGVYPFQARLAHTIELVHHGSLNLFG